MITGNFLVNAIVVIAIASIFQTVTSKPFRGFDDYAGVGLTAKGVRRIKDISGESVGKKLGVTRPPKTKILGGSGIHTPEKEEHEVTKKPKPTHTETDSKPVAMSKRAKKWWNFTDKHEGESREAAHDDIDKHSGKGDQGAKSGKGNEIVA